MVDMDDILSANIGENSGEIRVVFKKTIQRNQYEPEVIEVESAVKFSEEMSSQEKMLVTALLSAQVEYTAFINLVFKELITKDDFEKRKQALESNINAIKEKAEALGKDTAKIFGK